MSLDYGQWYTLPQARYEEELGRWFKERAGYELNLEQPQTLNEKIQWLKLYDCTPEKTKLADKYLVRQWVAEKIGEQYLTPLLHTFESFDDVDFDLLPPRFALKPNHGAGYHCIVADRADFDAERDRPKAARWLREDYAFRMGLELQYHGIERKVLIEEHLSNHGGKIVDYKVFCFHGKAESIMRIDHRGSDLVVQMYDLAWNLLPFTVEGLEWDNAPAPRPDNLAQLIRAAEKLSEEFVFVRVDFYRLDDGSIRFGEMTFTPGSGVLLWTDSDVDLRYGGLLTLPEKKPVPARRPAVSVAVTGYASPQQAKACIESLLGGQLEHIEILCADDGTDAAASAALEEAAARDARVKVLRLPGMDSCALRNAALDQACGEYMVFLYADGAVDSRLLMRLCERIAQQRADIALCGGACLRCEQDGSMHAFARVNALLPKERELFSGRETPVESIGPAAATLRGMMLRRSFLLGEGLRFAGRQKEDDAGFALRAVGTCGRITAAQEKLLEYPVQAMDARQLAEEAKRLKEAFADKGDALKNAWQLCLFELKKAGGGQYAALYRAMKDWGLAQIGLQAGNIPEGMARRRQLQAMLAGDVMIRFE